MAGAAGVRWPDGCIASLAPGAAVPDGLELGAPTPCKAGSVAYWSLGGSGKARLRVLEDDHKLLQLSEVFTLGVLFRAGAGDEPGHDSLLLGHDNKHWLALEGGKRTLCMVDSAGGKTLALGHKVTTDAWSVVFLQSRWKDTAVFAFDEESLVDLGEAGLSLAGSRLRNLGWASNEVQVAELVVWTRNLSWGEMAGSFLREHPPPTPEPCPEARKPRRRFRGQVVDTSGKAVDEVYVSWPSGGCVTDEDGCFEASLSDAETEAPPDTASCSSRGSADSWLSFSFSREGFAPAAMPAQGVPGQEATLQVTLRPVCATTTLSAEKGGSVADPASGSSVSVPPNGLCYPDGSPVSGEVKVSLSVIDATDPAALASMPGDFSAVGPDGSKVYMQSLGAVWIGATDEAGKELAVSQDSPGVTLDLKSNAAVNAEKLGTLPDMWTFDEASGKWQAEPSGLKVDGQAAPNPSRPISEAVEEEEYGGPKAKGKMGKMKKPMMKGERRLIGGCMSQEDFRKKMAAEGAKSLEANVKKLGWINCDIVYSHPTTAVMLTGKVLDDLGQPLANSQLWSAGRDYQGRCPDHTDAEGKFGELVAQFDSEVDVEVHVRREVEDDAKLQVSCARLPKEAGKESRELLEEASGSHKKQAELVSGFPAWKNGRSQVSWCPKRHQWQHVVGETLVFVRDELEDPPAPPFGPGWRAAPGFLARLKPLPTISAPTYARATVVKKFAAGPFHTGKPGDITDLGEVVIKCSEPWS